MKKISSVLLAFLMLVSSLFCANAAFGEDWSSRNGKNTFQSAENLVIGTIYNRPATEITGTVFKLDLNQAAKYTLSISSNSAAKVEIYQNDEKNIIDTVFVLGDKAQKKVTDKNFDFLKGTYYFRILSAGDYTFSVSNYVCNHYFDVVTASAEAGYEKPDLRIFRLALEQAGCNPQNAIMVGDRLENDIVPARQLGMKTIWVRQGFAKYQSVEKECEKPDYIIENIGEIVKVLMGRT